MPIEVIYPRLPQESAKDYSFKNLLFNIATLILPPGVNIDEGAIATKLDVSRTPVREAILRLNREYFLDIQPQKSTSVSRIDINFIEQGMFALQAIEKAMIENYCLTSQHAFIVQVHRIIDELKETFEREDALSFFQLNYDFHSLLFSACGKDKVFITLQFFYFHILRQAMVDVRVIPLNRLIDDMKGLVAAIEEKNIKKAIMHHTFYIEHLMSDHETLKTAYPTYFI